MSNRSIHASAGVLFVLLLSGCPNQAEVVSLKNPPIITSAATTATVAPQGAPTATNFAQPSPTASPLNLPSLFEPTNMPFYNQADPGFGTSWLPDPNNSELCGPAAAAMALAAVANKIQITKAVVPSNTTWLGANFINKSPVVRMANLGSVMGTVITHPGGTDFTRLASAYTGYASSFVGDGIQYSSGTTLSYIAQVTEAGLKNLINPGNGLTANVPVLMVGYYTQDPTPQTVAGITFNVYHRNGGHFVAVSGYTVDSTGLSFRIHDPNYLGTAQATTDSLTLTQSTLLPGASFLRTFTSNPGQLDPYNSTNQADRLPIAGMGYLTLQSVGNMYAVVEGYSALSVPIR